MSEPTILTFDIGTQSLRGMIVSKRGEILAFERIDYADPYISLHPGWAEQKPDFYFRKLSEISKKLKQNYSHLFKSIIGVTVASMRDSVLCLDKDYKPLRNIILWMDKRETNRASENVPLWLRCALKVIKMKETFNRQLRMVPYNWIAENEKEVLQKTFKYVMLPTYINYLLTGNLVDSVANMIGYVPLNTKLRRWSKGFCIMKYIANIDRKKLIDLCESGDIIGYITKSCARKTGIPEGIPLIATGSDKSCETLGVSATKPHQAAVSFGTSVTIQVTSKKYFTPAPFTPSYPSVYKDYHNAEIQIYRGYWMISWFKKEFAQKEHMEAMLMGTTLENMLSKRLFQIPAGCNGLMLQPYWGSGVLTPNAKGAIIGFTDIHTRLHIYKAIIEGIGFAMLDGLNILEKRSKTKITEIYVSGGGSQSDEICQMMSNMSNLPVKKMQTPEACGIGASIIGFVALKEFDNYDEAIENMCHLKKTFNPDAKEYAVYQKLFKEIYLEMFAKLEPLYKKINPILKEQSE